MNKLQRHYKKKGWGPYLRIELVTKTTLLTFLSHPLPVSQHQATPFLEMKSSFI